MSKEKITVNKNMNMDELRNKKAQLEKELLEKRIQKEKDENEYLLAKAEKDKLNLEEKTQELMLKERDLISSIDRNTKLEKENVAYKNKINELNTTLISFEEQSTNSIQALDEKLTSSKLEIFTLTKTIEKLNKDLFDLQKENTILIEKLNDLNTIRQNISDFNKINDNYNSVILNDFKENKARLQEIFNNIETYFKIESMPNNKKTQVTQSTKLNVHHNQKHHIKGKK